MNSERQPLRHDVGCITRIVDEALFGPSLSSERRACLVELWLHDPAMSQQFASAAGEIQYEFHCGSGFWM